MALPNDNAVGSVKRKRPSILNWLFGVAILGAILLHRHYLDKPVVSPEVLASELTRRDGLLFHGDQKTPFTGFMVEKYPGGALKSRSSIRIGVLDGASEGWHTNGVLQVREIFRQGISHGLREKWYDTGTKWSEGLIIEGKHDGLFRRWHENGVLAEEVNMRQGEPDGLSRAFYPSGFLKAQATMQNGKVIERKSWEDGQLTGNPSVANAK